MCRTGSKRLTAGPQPLISGDKFATDKKIKLRARAMKTLTPKRGRRIDRLSERCRLCGEIIVMTIAVLVVSCC